MISTQFSGSKKEKSHDSELDRLNDDDNVNSNTNILENVAKNANANENENENEIRNTNETSSNSKDISSLLSPPEYINDSKTDSSSSSSTNLIPQKRPKKHFFTISSFFRHSSNNNNNNNNNKEPNSSSTSTSTSHSTNSDTISNNTSHASSNRSNNKDYHYSKYATISSTSSASSSSSSPKLSTTTTTTTTTNESISSTTSSPMTSSLIHTTGSSTSQKHHYKIPLIEIFAPTSPPTSTQDSSSSSNNNNNNNNNNNSQTADLLLKKQRSSIINFGLNSTSSSSSSSATTPTNSTSQIKKGEHSFTHFQSVGGKSCEICSKTISKWGDSKLGLQCEACGVVCHINCLPLMGTECLLRPVLHEKQAIVALTTQSLDKSNSFPDSIQPRMTKTSSYFLRLRLEAERQHPTLGSSYYISWIEMLLDFVKNTAKFLENESQPWQDLLEVFQQTSQMSLRHVSLPKEEKQKLLSDSYEAVKNVLLDHKFYGNAFVKLKDIAILDFAQQLTLEDTRLYNRITSSECYGTAWIKKNKTTQAPNIVSCINHFNKLTLFVVTSILTKKNATGRASYIVYFVKLAQACRHAHNYNSLNAILVGLDSNPIYRLKKTWEHVGSKYISILKELRLLMSAENNFAVLRQCLKSIKSDPNPSSSHAIPYLGMFLSDLSYVDAAYATNPSVRNEKSAEIIIQISSFQSACSFAPILGLQDYVMNLPACNEEENYSMSIQREPKLDNRVIDKMSILQSLENVPINELREAFEKYSRREKEINAEINMLFENRQKHEERGVRWASQEKSVEAWDLMTLVSEIGKMLTQAEERLAAMRVSEASEETFSHFQDNQISSSTEFLNVKE